MAHPIHTYILDELPIRYLHSSDTGEKMGVQYISYSLYSYQFEVSMELVGFIKMCSNVTYSKVNIDKHASDTFLFKVV
jgi:hypothetical protein